MRLDQFLVKSNICSRSEAKQYIKKGRVLVDGKSVKDSALHIDENNSVVTFDGNVVSYEEFHYYMLNKPQGCVSATRDGLSDTVIDLLKGVPTKDLFPVGRLDKDTEGLLIITDDGKLAHNLLSPKHHVDKTYFVVADRQLLTEHLEMMEQGMDIGDDKPTMPARITQCEEKESNMDGFLYRLTICEGRFHQVKRMFEKCGSTVIYLKRESMGSLVLDHKLQPGEFRSLTEKEISELKAH